MRSLLVVSLALLPPLLTTLWMRLQLRLAEKDLGAWAEPAAVPLED